MTWTTHESPLGRLTLVGGPAGLGALRFPDANRTAGAHADRQPGAFAEARRQLDAYFAGERTTFDLDLDLAGTTFQRRVWGLLREIPYGTTVTYGELAAELGRRDRVRAVGAAVGRTPVPIVVPCHRVVGADGGLTGYGGGLARKRALLDLEDGQLTLGAAQSEERAPSRMPSAAAFASRWTA